MPQFRLDEERIAAATAEEKPIRLYDGDGLHLLVQPSGTKLWRFKYRFAGKQGTVSAGRYPSVGLTEARIRRDEYRALLAQGIDPSEVRRAERARERDDSARQRYEMRFAIESDGALAIRLGIRHIRLTPVETAALRRFLDATRAVAEGRR